jgi:hypothetical protein
VSTNGQEKLRALMAAGRIFCITCLGEACAGKCKFVRPGCGSRCGAIETRCEPRVKRHTAVVDRRAVSKSSASRGL